MSFKYSSCSAYRSLENLDNEIIDVKVIETKLLEFKRDKQKLLPLLENIAKDTNTKKAEIYKELIKLNKNNLQQSQLFLPLKEKLKEYGVIKETGNKNHKPKDSITNITPLAEFGVNYDQFQGRTKGKEVEN
ncbi:hypothetical protein [Helicobacter sp. WB40]|uniref:hypothetical protein n=1 Tax=Helicobacter sp. WB40 TaxID=3004130 RepID=UPI0022EBF226|nr:hypothetical protein [Helicobacter sp. WB40]MDA3968036.1 hypothetical protein [Helicobacter sp. WB40]